MSSRCRVAVVGCSGSGKTTLARALAARLGVPFVELDGLFHQPGWTELPDDEFRAAVAAAVAGDAWVVDGNYDGKLGDLVRSRADAVVWLDYPRWRVMGRVTRRTLRRVAIREELWNGNREPWSNLWSRDPQRSIIAWSWTHHAVYRERYAAAAAAEASPSRWIRLRSTAEARRWLATVPLSPAGASS